MTADLIPYVFAMSVVALLFSLPILRRPGTGAAPSRSEQQRRYWQQRNEEIDADHQAGLIDSALRQQLKDELDAQLVDESLQVPEQPTEGGDKGGRGVSWWISVVLLALLPVCVVLIYDRLGAAEDVRLRQQLTDWEQSPSPSMEQTQSLLSALQDRVEERPESDDHRSLLAALLVQMNRPQQAEIWYRQLSEEAPEDAYRLALWAQAAYLANERQLTPELRQALLRSLQLDPEQKTALGLLGVDAYTRADYAAAVEYWQRMIRILPPGSGEAMMISDGLQRARLQAIEAGTLAGLVVDVRVAEALQSPPSAVLFLFARGDDGARMPVAVRRIAGYDGRPMRLSLTDADMMQPGRQLSDYSKVRVFARLSADGQLNRSDSDLVAESDWIEKQQWRQPLSLVLDNSGAQ